MSVDFNYEYRADDLQSLELEPLAELVLEQEDYADAQASITFVDDEEIARLNLEYRGKSGPTDVLSFECDGLDDDFPEGPDGEEEFVLGDIFIAADVAERQAQEYGTTFRGEMSLLIVHGLLHLCGYDHIDDDEAEEMKQREFELLSAWGESQGDATAAQTLLLSRHPSHVAGDD